jgi:hypothetical protein
MKFTQGNILPDILLKKLDDESSMNPSTDSQIAQSEHHPRVLVFSPEPFNRERGCGITLINLFVGWPEDRLASNIRASVRQLRNKKKLS